MTASSRHTMAGVRDLGLVAPGEGHGGGWTIACDLDRITLHDVSVAPGSPEGFAMGHRSEAPTCLVEQAANAAPAGGFRDVELFFAALTWRGWIGRAERPSASRQFGAFVPVPITGRHARTAS